MLNGSVFFIFLDYLLDFDQLLVSIRYGNAAGFSSLKYTDLKLLPLENFQNCGKFYKSNFLVLKPY